MELIFLMAVYTTTLYELSSCLASGTMESRTEELKKYLFAYGTGLLNDLDSAFKDVFVNRFLFDEIGQETPERFRYVLCNAVKRKSPYYNQLWTWIKTVSQYNPMEYDVDMYNTSNENSTKKNENEITKDFKGDNTNTGTEHFLDKGNDNETSKRILDKEFHEGSESKITYDSTDATNITQTFNDIMSYTGTDKNTGRSTDQSQSEGSNSNFPQGNVAANRDYKSTGSEGWGKSQNDTQTLEERNLKDSHTGTITNSGDSSKKTGTDTTNNKLNNGGLDIDDYTKTAGHENTSDRDEQYITAIKNLEKVIEKMNETLERKNNSHEYGRNGRRNIGEIVQSLKNGFINVPEMICDDLDILFIGIL